MPLQNIVLIDDDAEDQEIFKTALNEVSKVECITFTDARQALHKLIDQELDADLIFLDLNMPVMSGQEFLSEIKKRKETQNIPVIIFSTTSNPSTVKLVKEMGAVEFITKPDRFDKLVNLLRPILTSQS